MKGRHKGFSPPEIVMLFVVLSCPEAVTWVKRLWVGVNNILCLSDNTKIFEPCWCKTKALVFSISAPGIEPTVCLLPRTGEYPRKCSKEFQTPFSHQSYRVFNLLSLLFYRLTMSSKIATAWRRIPTVCYECQLPDLAISPPCLQHPY